MFEAAELGHNLDKATYDLELPKLREGLLEAQYRLLREAPFSVVIVIEGLEGAGKSETVNALTEWMDPRNIQVHAMGRLSDEERERPPMWRFWRRLPPRSRLGIFFSSWYSDPIASRALGKTSTSRFGEALSEIRRFEQMLAEEGTLIVKFWFHLSKDAQRRRLEELWADKKTRFRVRKGDWKQLARYDSYRAASERALAETHFADAPWFIIEGVDARYRNFNAGRVLLDAIGGRLASSAQPKSSRAMVMPNIQRTPLVRTLDLSRRLDDEEYEEKLQKEQRRLVLLTQRRKFAKLSPVLVFEGVDAAGKGGAIRRLTQVLDARIYDVFAVAAPSDEEKQRPYLWRFWRHAPRDGKFAIFDRSWYGRVLVERVEKFASDSEWMRAYGEINDFEDQLARADNVVVKFWLQVSQEEQLRRFKAREETPFKRFKITADDWQNREKWGEYERAASDMIERTSTERAPWTLVEAEDKHFARVKILRTVSDAIERFL